jgi:hypothetical protein
MVFALELKYYEQCSFEFPMWSKTNRLVANNVLKIKMEKLSPYFKSLKVRIVYCIMYISCKTTHKSSTSDITIYIYIYMSYIPLLWIYISDH